MRWKAVVFHWMLLSSCLSNLLKDHTQFVGNRVKYRLESEANRVKTRLEILVSSIKKVVCEQSY